MYMIYCWIPFTAAMAVKEGSNTNVQLYAYLAKM